MASEANLKALSQSLFFVYAKAMFEEQVTKKRFVAIIACVNCRLVIQNGSVDISSAVLGVTRFFQEMTLRL